MVKLLQILAFLLAASVSAAGATDEYIYIVMKDDDTPIIDYEGNYLKRSSGYVAQENQKFNLTLIVLDVDITEKTFVMGGKNDTEDNQVINMSGTLERLGKTGIDISLKIVSNISGSVQFAKMKSNKEPENEFPEAPFGPGTSNIQFKGEILGWFKKKQ